MKKKAVQAATVLPLAIGLASGPVGDAVRSAPAPHHQAVATSTQQSLLAPVCTIAFDPIKQMHPIDDSCGADGSSAPQTPQAAQNEAKNNFCAAGPLVDVSFDEFDNLQSAAVAAHITFGSDARIPHDRSALMSLIQSHSGSVIGEGTLVRLAAFVLNPHYSNTSGGETVNCKTSGQEFNDIHIPLVQTPDADPCSSVTAEMSPHFRPDMWTPDVLDKVAGRPLRFTGQLFFDASHSPCVDGGRRANPPRHSLFEIHPVYAVEVCGTAVNTDKSAWLKQCESGDNATWVSLETWLGNDADEQEGN